MIEQLNRIANKPSRKIIGLMSGTSLDGLDLALCNITGTGTRTNLIIEKFTTIPYPSPLVEALRKISQPEVSLEQLTLWNVRLGKEFARMVMQCLEEWQVRTDEIDLIASHGQTIWHAPHSENDRATLQIADGDIIAVSTRIITISDFRMKHLAAGGEGAPLAGYGDYLLFANDDKNVVLLNIGGIANFTFIPHQNSKPLVCTDCGPGNTLMNAAMRKLFNRPFDTNGEHAAAGKPHHPLLERLLQHEFFQKPLPKSTGPESFHFAFVEHCLKEIGQPLISAEDLMATLNRFTAEGIAHTIQQSGVEGSFNLYISGGGLHNATLIKNIAEKLPQASLKKLPLLPDAKEAALFALLANECVAGDPSVFNNTGLLPVRLGKISFPD